MGDIVNEQLLDSFRHNSWATRQLVQFCRDQNFTAEQLTTPASARSAASWPR